jgi:hypothetical protein
MRPVIRGRGPQNSQSPGELSSDPPAGDLLAGSVDWGHLEYGRGQQQ